MRKIVLTLLTAAMSLSAFAEGYQVNVMSTKQTGMGHVGTAMKLGAESIHFNPAGLSFMEHPMDVSLGITGIYTKAKYKEGDYKAHTNNPISTPFYAYAGFKVSENFAFGLGINTPYGSHLKWPKNWKGADLVEEISLKSYVLQPTVSYKFLDNKLSIGAGLQLAIGNVSLTRGLMPVGYISTLAGSNPIVGGILGQMGINAADYDDVVPARAKVTGKSKVGVGYNIGVMYNVSEKVTVGATYRGEIKMKVDHGDAKLEFAGEKLKQVLSSILPPLEEGTFRAQLPMPANLTVGVAYQPTDRWDLSLDIQGVFWNAYDSLNLKFTENVLNGYEIKAPKHYHNTMIFRTGAQYQATERTQVRAGFYFDTTPIRKNYYNPETPGMNKIGLSAGSSYMPFENFEMDFAFLYIQGIGRDGAYTYPDVLNKKVMRTFEGHYNSHAFSLSIGFAYKF
ncbi:MAG: OmpP1/FadL family transporter [Marinifilaceae bacterium]